MRLRFGIVVSCGVGHRLGSDPALLWLWCRPGATAPIRPLAWEPPYAAGVAQRNSKKKKKKIKEQMSLAATWMQLDILILSEVSQKEKRPVL